jgi:hypothetical protein
MVEIVDKLNGEVLLEMKGNGLSSACENDLVQFLWLE